MPQRTEWFLAWRYIRANKSDRFISLTSWLAVTGMVLGVATLILVHSLMNGIQLEMRNQLLGVDGHISVSSPARGLGGYRDLSAHLESLPNIASVTPKIRGQVMAATRGFSSGARVIAMQDDTLKHHSLFGERLYAGSIEAMLDDGGVMLGVGLARMLRVQVGDSVRLILPDGNATIAGVIPRVKAFKVSAIFKLGMHANDSSLLVMPFDQAQRFFKLSGSDADSDGAVSEVELMLEDSDLLDESLDVLRANLKPSAIIQDWKTANAGVFAALKVQRNVMLVILTLIVLVAAFNIVATLVMVVKEKRADIAVLRGLGASKAMVLRVFLLVGGLLALTGITLGVVLGLLLARYIEHIRVFLEQLTGQSLLPENIYFLSTLPTKTDFSQVGIIIGFALILSLLASLYPALKAARTHPVKVFRDE